MPTPKKEPATSPNQRRRFIVSVPVDVIVETATPYDAWWAAVNLVVETLKQASPDGRLRVAHGKRNYTPSLVKRVNE